MSGQVLYCHGMHAHYAYVTNTLPPNYQEPYQKGVQPRKCLFAEQTTLRVFATLGEYVPSCSSS